MRCRVLSASDSSNSESPWGRGGLDAMAGTGQSWDWEWQAGPPGLLCGPQAPGVRGGGGGGIPGGSRRPWQGVALEQKGLEAARLGACSCSEGGRRPLWPQQPGQGDESPVVLGPVGLRGDSAFMLSNGATAGSGVGGGLALAWVGLSRALVLGRAPPVGRADPGGRHDGGRPCRAELSVADLPVGVGLRGGEDDRLRARVSVWR